MNIDLITQPHSLEAENAVLGAMILEVSCLEEGVNSLRADDFYSPSNKIIYQTVQELYREGKPVDLVSVTEKLNDKGLLNSIGGVSYLSSLLNIPSTANTSYYIELVVNKSKLRKLIGIGKKLMDLGFQEPDSEEALNQAESLIYSLATEDKSKGMEQTKDFIYEYYYELKARSKRENGITGVPTGFKDLDRILAGLQPSDLIVVAGRPSMGKTAFSLNLAENCCDVGGKVGIFSLEMSKQQLLERMVSSQSRVAGEYLKTGTMTEDQWKRVKDAMARIKGWELFIDDTSNFTVTQMRSLVRKSHAEKPFDLIIIDYLQLINFEGKQGNKADQIGEVTKALKQLARELNCPIVVLSQLSRGVEAREDKRPMLSDLRDSGAIEQDADVVLFLYRDEYYDLDSPKKGIAEVIIGKHRKGAVGKVELAFLKSHSRFVDLDKKNFF